MLHVFFCLVLLQIHFYNLHLFLRSRHVHLLVIWYHSSKRLTKLTTEIFHFLKALTLAFPETFKKAGSASFLLLFPRHHLGHIFFKSWRTDTWVSEWGFDLPPQFVCVVAHASVKHRTHLGCVRRPCLSARCYTIMQMTQQVISTKKPLNVRQSQAFLRGWQSVGKMESNHAAVGDGWKQ